MHEEFVRLYQEPGVNYCFNAREFYIPTQNIIYGFFLTKFGFLGSSGFFFVLGLFFSVVS